MTVWYGLSPPRCDLAGGHQARVDRVAELGDDDQVVQRHCLRLGSVPHPAVPVRPLCRRSPCRSLHQPQPLVALLGRSARRQYAHLVALADRALRQFHRFRAVALEVQAERQPRRQLLELPLQVGSQLRIFCLGLGNQVSQSGHMGSSFSLCGYVPPGNSRSRSGAASRPASASDRPIVRGRALTLVGSTSTTHSCPTSGRRIYCSPR